MKNLTSTFSLLLIVCLMMSCAIFEKSVGKTKETRPQTLDPLIELAIKDLQEVKIEEIYAGHARRISRPFPKSLIEANLEIDLRCNDKETKYRIHNGEIIVYLASSYNDPIDYNCLLSFDGEAMPEAQTLELFSIKSVPFNYKVEKLNVPKKHIDLAPADIERWKRERDLQIKIYNSSVKFPLFDEPFRQPLKSKITSNFGNKRLFNNKKSSWHSGWDYRAPTGTPIPVANRGRVVYAGNFFFNGGIVIVDHGMDIFTMYCHLSKVRAKIGEIVPKGSIIGLSGSTGRSSGPHLHWGLKVQGEWVSGIPFTKEFKKN